MHIAPRTALDISHPSVPGDRDKETPDKLAKKFGQEVLRPDLHLDLSPCLCNRQIPYSPMKYRHNREHEINTSLSAIRDTEIGRGRQGEREREGGSERD